MTNDTMQHHMRGKRAITISRTTTTIIIIASCAAAALFSLILGIWLHRRHRRRQRASTSTRGSYKKLQKRDTSRTPQPSLKRTSSSTTRESSRRHSPSSIPKYQNQVLLDLEAQNAECQCQCRCRSQDSTHSQPNTSLPSVLSFKPKHLSREPLIAPQVPFPIYSDTSISKTSAPGPAPNINTLTPTRNPSTGPKSDHTNTEYSPLIISDIQTLTTNMPLPPPPPPIPRKSSRRSSEPTSIDTRLAASMRREATLSVPRQRQSQSQSQSHGASGQRTRSVGPVRKFEMAA